MANYRLLGWHKSFYGNSRIDRWLAARKKVTSSALSIIPGGKNVAQYMNDNGWFDFGPQIKAKSTDCIITPDKLRNYEPVVLFYSKKDMKIYFTIGLVNSRLEVQRVLIQTPVMIVAEGKDYPTLFEWTSVDEIIICQLKRIFDTICVSLKRNKYHRIAVTNSRFEKKLRVVPSVYSKFDDKGKKYQNYVQTSQSVKGILSLEIVSLEVFPGESYVLMDKIIKLKQLQLMPGSHACMFSQIED